MRGSWKLLRVAGIDVSVHWTFALLLIWVSLSTVSAGGLTHAAGEVLFVVLLFGCVVLHELGHALAARAFGIPTHGITLLPIGGVAQLDRIPRNPFQELVIALAGPAVNVAIASLLIPIVVALYGLGQISPWGLTSGGFVARLLLVNLVLVVFNLIPAFPMDGGRVLRALLALLTDYHRATRIAVRVGQVAAVGLGIVGFLFLHNALLLLIAAFVFFAAEGELRHSLLEPSWPAAATAYPHQSSTAWNPVTTAPPLGHQELMWNRPSAGHPGIVTVVVWPDVPAASQLD